MFFCVALFHIASAGDTDVNVFVVRMQGLPYRAKEEDIVSCCVVSGAFFTQSSLTNMVQVFRISALAFFSELLVAFV